MSPKQILLELYNKAKERANLITDDPELHDYLNKLETEINLMYEGEADSEGDPGGNNPPAPKIP